MQRLLLVTTLALLSACSSLLPATGALDGEWRLLSGSWRGSPVPVLDDAPITLTVDGDTAGGRSACNNYFASLERNGDGARFSGIGGTEMGCDQAVMALETTYVGALGAVTQWRRDGDRLTLSGPDVELTYAVVTPPADAALVGTAWQLETLERDGTASNASDFDRVSMAFAADGTVSGTAGCSAWEGRWHDRGDHVEVSDVTIQVARCAAPDVAGSADEAVLGVVADGFVARIEGSALRVEAEAGTGLVFGDRS